MSFSPMDLDSSLDDLIKKRKQPIKKHHNNTNSSSSSSKGKYHQQQHQQEIKPRHSLHIHTKAKINKSPQPQRSGINSRLSTSTKPLTAASTGPLFTSKTQPRSQQQRQQRPPGTDPSQIIITKAISPNSPFVNRKPIIESSNSSKSMLSSRLGSQEAKKKEEYVRPSISIASTPSSSFSIRGRSNVAAPSTGMSIKGESGPTTILVSGLDKGANSEDVRVAFEEFGNILTCEVLRSRDGRSFGEAEIEYSSKIAALDCIAKVDNQIADGRPLRVILRDKKSRSVTTAYSSPPAAVAAAPRPVQSVISTPSYTPSGKMYADQLPAPRYDIRR